MSDQFAVVAANVPNATSTVNYTDPAITNCRAAWIFLCGEYITENGGAVYGSAHATVGAGSTLVAGELHSYLRAGSQASTLARSEAAQHATLAGVVNLHDPATVGTEEAIGTIAFLAAGISIQWTTVPASKVCRVVILLVGGTADEASGLNSETTSLHTGRGPFDLYVTQGVLNLAQLLGGMVAGMGAAVIDGGVIKQGYVGSRWPTAKSPVECGQAAFNDKFSANIPDTLASILGSRAITAFNVNGITVSDTGTIGGQTYAGLKFTDAVRSPLLSLETLSTASTGVQRFTGCGKRPHFLVGMIVGANATGSLVTGAGSQQFGIFVIVNDIVHSLSWATDEGVTPSAGTPVLAFNRYKSGEINIISGAAGTAFRATDVELIDGGISMNIVTGMDGRMLVWGASVALGTPRRLRRRRPPEKKRRTQRQVRRVIQTAAKSSSKAKRGGRRQKPAQRASLRRGIRAGVKRAARYGRMLKALLRQRAAARRARRRALPEVPAFVRLVTDPALVRGDNACAGSLKGADACAGSVHGDSR